MRVRVKWDRQEEEVWRGWGRVGGAPGDSRRKTPAFFTTPLHPSMHVSFSLSLILSLLTDR